MRWGEAGCGKRGRNTCSEGRPRGGARLGERVVLDELDEPPLRGLVHGALALAAEVLRGEPKEKGGTALKTARKESGFRAPRKRAAAAQVARPAVATFSPRLAFTKSVRVGHLVLFMCTWSRFAMKSL